VNVVFSIQIYVPTSHIYSSQYCQPIRLSDGQQFVQNSSAAVYCTINIEIVVSVVGGTRLFKVHTPCVAGGIFCLRRRGAHLEEAQTRPKSKEATYAKAADK
jgi:hypothetical protein